MHRATRFVCVAVLCAAFLAASSGVALAAYLSDPPVTVTEIAPGTWQSMKDLDHPRWHYVPGGHGDIIYAGESGTYTEFTVPDAAVPPAEAKLTLRGSLDDHYPGAPWPWVSATPYDVDVYLNGTKVADVSPWPHGREYNTPFYNLSEWDIDLDPALVESSNDVQVVVNRGPARTGDWIVIDWIALTVTGKPLAATVDVKPDTLNLKSKSDKNAVTIYIELPDGNDPAAIDVSTLRLAGPLGDVPALAAPSAVGDYDADGVPDLMVKFDRAAVIAVSQPGATAYTVIGSLTSGKGLIGADTVNVIAPPK